MPGIKSFFGSGQLDRVLTGQRQLREVLVRHDHVIVLGVFVAADDLAPFDLAIVLRAPAQLLQPDAVFLVQQAKRNVFTIGGGVELDRDADHPKADHAVPDRPCHGWQPSTLGGRPMGAAFVIAVAQ